MLAMQSTTTIQVHPAMPLNFAVSPTLAAGQVNCSFASSDGQSYVAAVQPIANAGTVQHVILPSGPMLSPSAMQCAVPVQGLTPLSPTMAAYACPVPAAAATLGQAQQPVTMAGMLVPAATTPTRGVTSPRKTVSSGTWPVAVSYSADSVASPTAAYSVQDPMQYLQRCNPYISLAEAQSRMPRRARDCTRLLRDWLMAHRHNPYPQKSDKVQLMLMSGLTINQVSMWFANARRRIKKVGMKAWSKGLCEDLPGTGDFDNDSELDEVEIASDDAMGGDSDSMDNSAGDMHDSSRRYSCPTEYYSRSTTGVNFSHTSHTRDGRSLSCSEVESARRTVVVPKQQHSADPSCVEFSPATTPQSSSGVADRSSSSSGYATNDTTTHAGSQVLEQEDQNQGRPHYVTLQPTTIAPAQQMPPLMMSSLLASSANLAPSVPWRLRQFPETLGEPQEPIHRK